MADSGTWRWQIETLRKQFPGLGLNSSYRAGDPGWHGKGNAVDVPPRMDVFNWIHDNYPGSAELIFSPAGNRQIKNGQPHVYSGAVKAQHYSHVHWAVAAPGGASGGADASAGENPLLAPITETYGALQSIYSFVKFIANPGSWVRVGAAIFGSLILIAGLWGLANGSKNVTHAVKGSVKGLQKAVNV